MPYSHCPLLPNHAATFHTFELWPGGRWRFVMHGPDGTDYPNESGFRERIAKFVCGANEQNLSRLANEVLNVR